MGKVPQFARIPSKSDAARACRPRCAWRTGVRACDVVRRFPRETDRALVGRFTAFGHSEGAIVVGQSRIRNVPLKAQREQRELADQPIRVESTAAIKMSPSRICRSLRNR
jgi:hypothetical protein